MGWRRRELLGVVGLAALAGCGSTELAGSATPPPESFRVTRTADHAVALEYHGIGSQDPRAFRVILDGAGAADGTYPLGELTDDTAWNDEDRYVLDQTSLGLSEPLTVGNLAVTLQYHDDGDWLTLVRANPAD